MVRYAKRENAKLTSRIFFIPITYGFCRYDGRINIVRYCQLILPGRFAVLWGLEYYDKYCEVDFAGTVNLRNLVI